MGFSKHFIVVVNLATLFLSIPIFSAGIWLSARHHTDCYQFLQGPVITVGFFMFLVSLAGVVGSYMKKTWLMCLYLCIMAVLIILLFCFTVFAFAVTQEGSGEDVPEKAYKDYRLGDFSNWMQSSLGSDSTWSKVKSCLQDAQFCQGLDVYENVTAFDNAELSPLESGCCKPPSVCKYLFLNATYWTRPLDEQADPDCHSYSYQQDELCFDCNSCKAGVIAQVKHDWRKVAAVNITVFMFMVVVFAAACYSFYQARKEGQYTGYNKETI